MEGIKYIEAVFQLQLAPLAVVEQDQQTGSKRTDRGLISCCTHVGQEEQQYLVDPMLTANIKCGDKQDTLHTVIAVDQLGKNGEEGYAASLKKDGFALSGAAVRLTGELLQAQQGQQPEKQRKKDVLVGKIEGNVPSMRA